MSVDMKGTLYGALVERFGGYAPLQRIGPHRLQATLAENQDFRLIYFVNHDNDSTNTFGADVASFCQHPLTTSLLLEVVANREGVVLYNGDKPISEFHANETDVGGCVERILAEWIKHTGIGSIN